MSACVLHPPESCNNNHWSIEPRSPELLTAQAVSTQSGPVATALFTFVSFVVDAQHHVLGQNREPLAFLAPSGLFNAHDLPIRFHSCFTVNSREHREEDLETNLDSPRWAGAGEHERAFLADVPSSTFALSYRPAVRPPKHCRRLQGKPHDSSAVSLPMHPSPRVSRPCYASAQDVHKRCNVLQARDICLN